MQYEAGTDPGIFIYLFIYFARGDYHFELKFNNKKCPHYHFHYQIFIMLLLVVVLLYIMIITFIIIIDRNHHLCYIIIISSL